MSDILYQTLEAVPSEELHQTFLEAFSDYFVEVKATIEEFRRMHEIRGVDYSASMGVFKGRRLVGFTFNGIGEWDGRLTVYDAGTGVVKDQRRQGLSREMFRRLLPVLAARGIQRYLLEVVADNVGALRLYQGLGFEITRRFACLKFHTAGFRPRDASPAMSPAAIREVAPSEWDRLKKELAEDSERSFQPAWQNSWDAIERVPDHFRLHGAFDGSRCIAYVAFTPRTGAIPQLWVRSDRRRQGLGTALIGQLCAVYRDLKGFTYVNIDERSQETVLFLKQLGFQDFVSQYEMQLESLSSLA